MLLHNLPASLVVTVKLLLADCNTAEQRFPLPPDLIASLLLLVLLILVKLGCMLHEFVVAVTSPSALFVLGWIRVAKGGQITASDDCTCWNWLDVGAAEDEHDEVTDVDGDNEDKPLVSCLLIKVEPPLAPLAGSWFEEFIMAICAVLAAWR